jgi:GrpB-like predicted nucleotidyltransferase (UPF0157 family)
VTRVEIVEPDPRWPAEFATIARDLRGALGDLAERVDHIGSTAVPGLAAKDVIDVQVTTATLDPLVLDTPLGRLGYTRAEDIDRDHRPPGAEGDAPERWRKRLYRPPPGQRRTNVHVRLAGSPNQRYALLFRDHLRAYPRAAEGYARLKRELSRRLPDIDDYVEVKDPVCDILMAAAEDWAARTGWRPGPSDA